MTPKQRKKLSAEAHTAVAATFEELGYDAPFMDLVEDALDRLCELYIDELKQDEDDSLYQLMADEIDAYVSAELETC